AAPALAPSAGLVETEATAQYSTGSLIETREPSAARGRFGVPSYAREPQRRAPCVVLSRNNPLERHYRDVLCSRIHSLQNDTILVSAGASAFGV
ncbi:MAG: hypothetical protein RL701_1258, partial [Pseudomonadota bacterium]